MKTLCDAAKYPSHRAGMFFKLFKLIFSWVDSLCMKVCSLKVSSARKVFLTEDRPEIARAFRVRSSSLIKIHSIILSSGPSRYESIQQQNDDPLK